MTFNQGCGADKKGVGTH